jgi:hypothetical protein
MWGGPPISILTIVTLFDSNSLEKKKAIIVHKNGKNILSIA